MNTKPILLASVMLLYCIMNHHAVAAPPFLKQFKTGSYQQILDKQKGKPFVLVIWSLMCPSCIKDMEQLDTLHKKFPHLNFVMLSTDEPADAEDIEAMLEKYHLSDVENWVFADDDAQKLRFEIDPAWFGEMPRTYFFDKTHSRAGVSGVLSGQEFEERIGRITQP